MSVLKSTPSFWSTPSRKPCDRPSVLFGFMAARMRGYRSACENKQSQTCLVESSLRQDSHCRLEACRLLQGALAEVMLHGQGSVRCGVHHCDQE